MTLALGFVKVAISPLLRVFGQADPLTLFTTSFEPHDFSAIEMLAFALQGLLAARKSGGGAHAPRVGALTR